MPIGMQQPPQSVVTLEYDLAREEWIQRLNNDFKTASDLPSICFAFMTRSKFLDLNENNAPLLRAFGAPRYLARPALNELNGYFGSRTRHAEMSDDLAQCSTWFQVLVKMVRIVPDKEKRPGDPEYVIDPNKDYIWYEMGFFTFWEKTTDDRGMDNIVLRILCVDTPTDTARGLKQLLEERDQPDGDINFHDPLALHGSLLEKVILLLDVAVWRVRDQVRDMEKSRLHTSARKRFELMHEIGRHGIHMSEVLEVCANTIESFIGYQKTVYDRMKGRLGDEYTLQAQEYTRFQLDAIKSLKLRSMSNDKRLENEITLAFNRIANSDNTVVKSIAVLTMFFLPSTFVSSIFSTSFFSFQDSGWTMSDQFWIFWAVAIPATLLAPIYMLCAFKKPKKVWAFFARQKQRQLAATATATV